MDSNKTSIIEMYPSITDACTQVAIVVAMLYNLYLVLFNSSTKSLHQKTFESENNNQSSYMGFYSFTKRLNPLVSTIRV